MTAMLNIVATGISKRGLELKKDIVQTVEVAGQAVCPPTMLLLFLIANKSWITAVKNIREYL
jgi:hypothetical protein